MSGVEQALLAAAQLGADDDVLVLGGGALALGAQKRLENGWVYVVRREVDELEELLREAHAVGASGLAYLVGDPAVLPLPDAAVAVALGRVGAEDGTAAVELARVVAAGGRVALATAEGEALVAALESAGFADISLADVGDEHVVTATRA